MKKKIRLLLLLAGITFFGACNNVKRLPSQEPPEGLKSEQVPQFVVFGFDDNRYSGLEGSGGDGGMTFITDLFAAHKNPAGSGNLRNYDGLSTYFSFYGTTAYIAEDRGENPVYNKKAWNRAIMAGNELGNHTHNHNSGAIFSSAQWQEQFDLWNKHVTSSFNPEESAENPDEKSGVGLHPAHIFGFRAPELEYNDGLFSVMQQNGYYYDSSIEEGYQPDQDGTNYFWPYTLDEGSPGDKLKATYLGLEPINPHPGLWEIPVYTLVAPPDEVADEYGVQTGFRAALAKRGDLPFYNPAQGKVPGLDSSLFDQFKMSKNEALAVLKYSLDQRLKGNRVPFTLVGHSGMYSNKYQKLDKTTAESRREVLKEFLEYALSKPDVRVVSAAQLLAWLSLPESL